MTKEQKAQWIAALRSGEFPQTTRTLIKWDDDKIVGYCCLGVAMTVCGAKPDINKEFLTEFLPLMTQARLAEMNDGPSSYPEPKGLEGSASFATIADYIERYVEAE